MLSLITIPKPCPVRAQALAPTEAGWHCARCATEVIDFTRFSEAEILAYLAARQGQRVCAAMRVPLVPRPYKRPRGPRRWVLAVAAFLGWQSAGALPPQSPPTARSFFGAAAIKGRIVIRGVVLDDSLHTPVAGAYVFVKGTKYGAVSNEKGEFTFSFAPDWKPAATGELTLEISAGHFTFESQSATVNFKDNPAPAPLTIRLLSIPHRGFVLGKIARMPPPVAPPDAGKTQP
jgi:hypothetical protein